MPVLTNLSTDDVVRIASYIADKSLITAECKDDVWSITYPAEIQEQVSAGQSATVDFVAVPEAVSMVRARTVLIVAGLIDAVEAALASDTSIQGKINQTQWEYATEVRRNSPLINSLGPSLGLTSSQIDDLFRQAAALN